MGVEMLYGRCLVGFVYERSMATFFAYEGFTRLRLSPGGPQTDDVQIEVILRVHT